MKIGTRLFLVLACLLLGSTGARSQVNNCITNFSTTNNPSGVWSYGLADDDPTSPGLLYVPQGNFIGLGAGWDTGGSPVPGMTVSTSWPGVSNPALLSHGDAVLKSALTYTAPAAGTVTISGGYFKGTEPAHLLRSARTRVVVNGVEIYRGCALQNDFITTGGAAASRPVFNQANPKPYQLRPFHVQAGDRIQFTNEPHDMTNNNSESVVGQDVTVTLAPDTGGKAHGRLYRLDQDYQTTNNPFGQDLAWSFYDQAGAKMVPATGTFGFSGGTWEQAGNPNAPPALFKGANFGLASNQIVYGHTPSGPGSYFEVRWQAPADGYASIDGLAYSAAVGAADLADRWVEVQVYKYDAQLSADALVTESGPMTKSVAETTQPGAGVLEANQGRPLSFLSFTGGPSAVKDIVVHSGDILKFRCRTSPVAPSPSGTFIAVSPDIYFVPDTVPGITHAVNNCITNFSTTNNPSGVWSYGLADDDPTSPGLLYVPQGSFIGLGAGWDTGGSPVPGMAVSTSWPGVPNPALLSHGDAVLKSALTYTAPAAGTITISGGYFKGTEPAHLLRNARTRVVVNGDEIYRGCALQNDRETTGGAMGSRPVFTQANPKPYQIRPFHVEAGDRIQFTNEPHDMTNNNSQSVFGQDLTVTLDSDTGGKAHGRLYRLDQDYQTTNNPFGQDLAWGFYDQAGAKMVPATGTFGFSGGTWEQSGNPNAPPAIFKGAAFGLASSQIVYGHTPSGPGSYFEVRWQAPADGYASIDGLVYSGAVGAADLADRWVEVQVYRYDARISSDSLLTESGPMTKSVAETTQPGVSVLEASQARPLSFLSFTNGPSAVKDVTVHSGDILKFRCRTSPVAPSPNGTFVALSPDIYFVPDTLPSAVRVWTLFE